MSKLILGLTGPIASGKGTIKKHLVEKYKADDCRFSSILRDVLTRTAVPISRENLQKVSTALRQTFGEDTLAKAIAADASTLKADIVVVDGVRRLADIKYLSQIPGFILVKVDADPKIRHNRVITRNENAGDAEKTFDHFLKDHESEADRDVPTVMSQAKESIENDSSLENLFAQVDVIVKKYQ